MAVTLKFLSEETGLSVTTVSLILNNKNVRVSEEKRKLVLELAKRYNYVPNQLARSLVTKKSKTVGLIIPDITNMFFSEIAKKVEQKLNAKGYSVFLCNTSDNPVAEVKYANLLLAKGVDALLVCPAVEANGSFDYIERFIKAGKGVIAFDRYYEGNPCSSAISDNLQGSSEAVKYLVRKGHRKIGCITGPANSYSSRLRLEGYRKALREEGIPFRERLVKIGNYKFDGGYEQGLALLQEDITAAFICNDLMAYGFYRACKETGKKIPGDISVIGFDDLVFSGMLDVPLTSVSQNVEALAENVLLLLEEALAGSQDVKHIVIPTSITERASVREIK